MRTLGILTIALSVLWFGSEVVLSIRRHSNAAVEGQDRFSFVIMWSAILLSIAAAGGMHYGVPQMRSIGKIGLPFLGYFGCLILVAGLVLRWVAIVTLGKQFTVQVSIVEDHKIISKGVYGVVRHPSYLGTLICLLGFGLAFENWIILIILVIPTLAATLYRIDVEEKALAKHFGSEYKKYAESTKRLIPGIY